MAAGFVVVHGPHDLSAFAELRGKEGKLDILVNCAGIYPMQALEEMPTQLWDRIQAVNLRGPMLCMREALKCLKDAPRARE